MACSIAKHRIGQMDFHLLILDGSTIRNQLRLGRDHRHGLYTTKVSANVWSTWLMGLICRLYSGFVSERTLFRIKPGWLRFREPITCHDITLNHLLDFSFLHSWKIFSAMETIYVLSTCQRMGLSFLKRHWMAWSLSNWLDAIKLVFPLCRYQLYYCYWSGFTK